MTKPAKQLKTTVYLTLEPTYSNNNWTPDEVIGFNVVKMTKPRPTGPAGFVVQVNLNVSDQSFKPAVFELNLDPSSANIIADLKMLHSELGDKP